MPEEIIHNDILREMVEAELASLRLRSYFTALCTKHVEKGETALRRSGAVNISRQPGFPEEGARCDYRILGKSRCGKPAEHDVDYDRWTPVDVQA